MTAIRQFIRLVLAAIEIGARAQDLQYRGPEALQALALDFRRRAGTDPADGEAQWQEVGVQPQQAHAERRHRHHSVVLGDC